jgi:MFS family permease
MFLGMCEGGLVGGMLVYLALFYRRHQLLYRIGMFACAAPLAVAFGGLLATGLSEIRHAGYNGIDFSRLFKAVINPVIIGWPWIFFIEGTITVCLGVLSLFFLPHTPGQARFLSQYERTIARRRIKLDAHGAIAEDDAGDEQFDWHWVWLASKSPNTVICSLAWFFLLIPIYVGLAIVHICLGLADTLHRVLHSSSLRLSRNWVIRPQRPNCSQVCSIGILMNINSFKQCLQICAPSLPS